MRPHDEIAAIVVERINVLAERINSITLRVNTLNDEISQIKIQLDTDITFYRLFGDLASCIMARVKKMPLSKGLDIDEAAEHLRLTILVPDPPNDDESALFFRLETLARKVQDEMHVDLLMVHHFYYKARCTAFHNGSKTLPKIDRLEIIQMRKKVSEGFIPKDYVEEKEMLMSIIDAAEKIMIQF